MSGAWADSGTALSRRFRACQRRAGRGAHRLSATAIACPCPLFPHASVVTASARVHRLDGRAVSRTAQVGEPMNFAAVYLFGGACALLGATLVIAARSPQP